MLSDVRQAYDHVRIDLVRDKDLSDVRQTNFLTLDKPTKDTCSDVWDCVETYMMDTAPRA
jgi:hypothetical protein